MCGCGDPLESVASSLPMAGRVTLGFSWDQQTASAGLDGDAPNIEQVTRQTLRAILAFAPTDRLTLLARIPYEQKAHSSTDLTVSGNDEADGLGDVDLGFQWILTQQRDPARRKARWLSLGLGSAINTGSNTLEDQGVRIDEHSQPGIGAAAPFLGLRANGEDGDLSHFIYLEGQWRATNGTGYQYGSTVRAGLGARYELFERLVPGLSLDARYSDYDHDWSADAIDGNTGGTLLSLTPLLGLRVAAGLAVQVKAAIPVWKGLFGAQDSLTAWSASLQWQY
jgi:hypothetical protein